MANPFLDFVANLSADLNAAKLLPLAEASGLRREEPPADAPLVMVFSPHPDDEVIIGALPLRLLREAHWRVLNVAVTLGSRRERQAERWRELQACCECIGFGLLSTGEHGLEGVNPRAPTAHPLEWRRQVDLIASIIARHRPRVVLLPHDRDWNGTHIGTHLLVMEALSRQPDGFTCHLVETEFWGAMDTPNLMIEISDTDLADLLGALSHHVGEVRRNPYHLRLPAWMIDNVRRGGELVGGQGAAVPDFQFATLYRHRLWLNGLPAPQHGPGILWPKDRNPAELFH